MGDYLLAQQPSPELERLRLRLLQAVQDPLTRGQLDAIGVGAGWRCLDAGAGAGSVTRMLADRVGPTGRVLAVDLETTLLERRASDRVEVRRLDLLADPLPQDAFDLVHARMLLMHLPGRLEVLRKLAAAAQPGGWVAALDPDFSTVSMAPSEPAWERTWSVFCDAVIAGGWDYTYGARLAADLGAAGLVDVHADYRYASGPGGSVGNQILSLTIERMRERLVALGAESEEIDAAQRLLEDPSRTFTSTTICLAHGRRPPVPGDPTGPRLASGPAVCGPVPAQPPSAPFPPSTPPRS